jgi:ABC-type polysaccharide/polyol phosphate transport system ATPase subunit
MSRVAIRVDTLSKQYRKGAAPSRKDRPTFREAIATSLSAPFQNLRTIRSLGAMGQTDPMELVWALQDVSFELREGEVLGIVGGNGAGKSTLLKVLSRITEPSSGRAEVLGRVGSLLEVGTGFHPDLTGRQNVYLNGAILGMKRHEITQRFDEIVEFSGVSAFIDTPVKRYSSGMQVRLAFAVAAYFEPDIMIVDEVLAVGDAEFQRKCLGKMDAAANDGRTVLFVSHNLNAVQRLCTRCILLKSGRLAADGTVADVTRQYVTDSLDASIVALPERWIQLQNPSRQGSGEARFDRVRYASDNTTVGLRAYSGGTIEFLLEISSDAERRASSLAITLYDQNGTKLVNADTIEIGHHVQLRRGQTVVSCRIAALHLRPGIYVVGLWLADGPGHVYDHIPAALLLDVADVQTHAFGGRGPGVVTCQFDVREVIPSEISRVGV